MSPQAVTLALAGAVNTLRDSAPEASDAKDVASETVGTSDLAVLPRSS
jgi:hypothetical protein